MTVYFTSDLHIGHRLVAGIRLRNRADLPHVVTMVEDLAPDIVADFHDDLLAENWDKQVGREDVVWVLGDLSVGGSAAQRKALAWVKARPGRKHLVPGNHDGVHPMHRDSYKWFPEYMEAFESIQVAARRNVPARFDMTREQGVSGVRQVLLSHLPYTGEGEARFEDGFTQWRLRDEGLPLLHGHVHTDAKYTVSRGLHTPQIHIGLDAWGLSPVSLERVSEFMDKEMK